MSDLPPVVLQKQEVPSYLSVLTGPRPLRPNWISSSHDTWNWVPPPAPWRNEPIQKPSITSGLEYGSWARKSVNVCNRRNVVVHAFPHGGSPRGPRGPDGRRLHTALVEDITGDRGVLEPYPLLRHSSSARARRSTGTTAIRTWTPNTPRGTASSNIGISRGLRSAGIASCSPALNSHRRVAAGDIGWILDKERQS